MRHRTRFGLAVFLAGLATVASTDAGTGDARSVIDAVRSAKLDTSASVEVANVEIDLGFGRLDIDSGWLFPAEAVSGRGLEVVFVGDATFEIAPPDEIEAAQLELFTGQEVLEALEATPG